MAMAMIEAGDMGRYIEMLMADPGEPDRLAKDLLINMASLTSRQREVMAQVLAGHPSKNIAPDLGISQRMVENHRAGIMKRTGTRSIPELARLAIAAAWSGTEVPAS